MTDEAQSQPQSAQIVGEVEYRQGDGPRVAIRKGPADVEITLIDATLSWTDGDTHGSAAMTIADFKRYVAEGAIQLH